MKLKENVGSATPKIEEQIPSDVNAHINEEIPPSDMIDSAMNDFKNNVNNISSRRMPSTCEMICRILLCDRSSKKRMLYNKTVEKTREFLDLSTLMKVMIELQFVKSILFSKDVQQLFTIFTNLNSITHDKASELQFILKRITSENNKDGDIGKLNAVAAKFFIENFIK